MLEFTSWRLLNCWSSLLILDFMPLISCQQNTTVATCPGFHTVFPVSALNSNSPNKGKWIAVVDNLWRYGLFHWLKQISQLFARLIHLKEKNKQWNKHLHVALENYFEMNNHKIEGKTELYWPVCCIHDVACSHLQYSSCKKCLKHILIQCIIIL